MKCTGEQLDEMLARHHKELEPFRRQAQLRLAWILSPMPPCSCLPGSYETGDYSPESTA